MQSFISIIISFFFNSRIALSLISECHRSGFLQQRVYVTFLFFTALLIYHILSMH